MRQLKDNNSGLSLIEVLVAMMILTIVVTPFLHSFFATARANNKAKQVHRATTVAQSVMEGIRAEDVENIAVQFNYPAANWQIMDSSSINNGNLTGHVGELTYDASAGTYSAVTKYEDVPVTEPDKKSLVTASVYSEDGGSHVEFLPNGTDKYYYFMDSVKQDQTSYDVLVQLDGKSADAQHFNNQNLVQLPIFDEKKDGICIEEKAYRENALNACDVTDLSGLRRSITITVNRTAIGGFGEQRVRVLAKFSYTNRTDSSKNFTKEITVFDSVESDGELRSVYLYYAPLYPTRAEYDRIEYINNDNVPLNLYILKQEFDNATALSSNAVETSTAREVGYQMELRLKSSAVTQWADCKTVLYTNLGTDMTNGNAIGSPHFSVTFNGTEDVGGVNKLTSEATDTRVFKLSVSIYENGAKTAGFPADKLLTTIESSKLD